MLVVVTEISKRKSVKFVENNRINFESVDLQHIQLEIAW
jgi:hypothetical protein